MSSVVLSLCWVVAALMTAVLVLLLTQPLWLPTCTSFDLAGQRAGQVGALVTIVVIVGLWVAAVAALRRYGRSTKERFLLAAALPLAILGAFLAGATAVEAAVDAVAPHSDRAMCF